MSIGGQNLLNNWHFEFMPGFRKHLADRGEAQHFWKYYL